MLIQKDSQSGGFGSERNTIREGIKNIDKKCDDIYNTMVKCYIESTRTKISQKIGLIEKTDNNYLLVNKKIFDIQYVTDNNLFESMVTREIIPKSENRIGTLAENPKSFLVIYKD